MTKIATLIAFIMKYAKEPSAPGLKEKRSMIFKTNERIRTFYSRRQLYINRAINIS